MNSEQEDLRRSYKFCLLSDALMYVYRDASNDCKFTDMKLIIVNNYLCLISINKPSHSPYGCFAAYGLNESPFPMRVYPLTYAAKNM
jgi:hypothetical protein